MQRFNQKNGPEEMTECEEGYWVKHSDALAVENHLSDRVKALSSSLDRCRSNLRQEFDKKFSLQGDLEQMRSIAAATTTVAIVAVSWIVWRIVSLL